jgi:hypothetical protein
MHLMLARIAITFVLAAIAANSNPEPKYRLVAYFDPPRSLGTPIGDLARTYGGPGLADRIAGRIRLDTDAALSDATRELIRQHLAQQS